MRLALALLMLSACSCAPVVPLTAPLTPSLGVADTILVQNDSLRLKAVPLRPPAVYWAWFAEAVRCSGSHGPKGARVERITWLATEAEPPSEPGYVQVGRWITPDTILLSSHAVQDPRVVIHEVLHYLRQRGGHPAVPFATCGVTDESAWLTRRVLETTLHTEAP
jgi:hypothetical protein